MTGVRAAALAVAFVPATAHAYIGPGAGFAFLGSTLVFIVAILMGLLTIAFWPIQWAVRRIRGRGVRKNARARRVVIVGLDGLEPKLVDRFMAEGRLPNLEALKGAGCYERLGTTLPALSPVAWSTFQTGVNPGAHNIFDFLTRDKRFCLPELASTEVERPGTFLKLGRFTLTLRSPRIRITRRSQPFWKVLGKYGVFSNVIRVPISYPPEKCFGNVLSAMCTPDLRGTQGTFTFFTTKQNGGASATGGDIRQLTTNSRPGVFHGEIEGPPNPADPSKPLKVAFSLEPDRASKRARLTLPGEELDLELDTFSRWVKLTFRFGAGKEISGIARFCLREVEPGLSLYVSPVNADPERPALPIASPLIFSTWLSKRIGRFGTLGLMEDTWGRNEFALDDRRFLEQAYLTHEERERMFFDVLERSKEGVCACVFDASDRIQHMFWRYLDEGHPAPLEGNGEFKHTIREMYERMDALVGRVREKLGEKDLLIVLSDHGFASFRRGINLNNWLHEQGYLALKNGKPTGADYFQDVDWSKTKAFACGLSGIYLNRTGRERFGTVRPGEVDALKRELSEKLEALRDPAGGETAIRKVYDSAKEYRGLYAEEAPDLIVGYAPGYRVSWDSVTGKFEPEVFSDNVKAWSGDHHVAPEEIPGIFFCNRKLKQEAPHIVDIAPTILDLFAVKIPPYMEGKVLL